MFADEVFDISEARAYGEDAIHAYGGEIFFVALGDGASNEDEGFMPDLALFGGLHHGLHELLVSARKEANADDVGGLFLCTVGYGFGGDPHAHIDDLHTGILEGSGDNFDATIMAIET